MNIKNMVYVAGSACLEVTIILSILVSKTYINLVNTYFEHVRMS